MFRKKTRDMEKEGIPSARRRKALRWKGEPLTSSGYTGDDDQACGEGKITFGGRIARRGNSGRRL